MVCEIACVRKWKKYQKSPRKHFEKRGRNKHNIFMGWKMEILVFIAKVTAGTVLGVFIHDFITLRVKPKQAEVKAIRREVPENYGKFADPIGEYEQFKDVKTNLYTSYVPKRRKRRSDEE